MAAQEGRQNAAAAAAEAAKDQAGRVIEQGRDIAASAIQQGTEHARQAGEAARTAATAGAKAATQSGSAFAEGVEDIAQAWSTYAGEVMRRTTEASRSMLQTRSPADMLSIQAELMRSHLEAFLSHSSRVAEITSRMAMRSLNAITTAGKETTGGGRGG
ncbi:MAG: phasin family protein [Alphaproteobacteria bacterium]|nr:phasin family protein [Alphaproteobacteria bacterium]